jgi:ABC-type antimicrobial peptide transport system permease subunit
MLTIIGCAIGASIASAAHWTLARLQNGFPAFEAVSLAEAIIAFATIAVIASYVPARRALCLDPIATLRRE